LSDCPLCKDARGINKKEKFIEHLDRHQEMAMNHDMMFRKFKEYVLAHLSLCPSDAAAEIMHLCPLLRGRGLFLFSTLLFS
jgi:hypothetical protein